LGDLFEVLPFINDLVRVTLSGAEIRELLNAQWNNRDVQSVLQISGLRYAWDNRRPRADKVVDIWDHAGVPLDPARDYTIAVNSFMSSGGTGFMVLPRGRDKTVGGGDLDALINYIRSLPQPFSVAIDSRIKRVDREEP